MSDRKNILLIATGGTIASKKSDNGLKPQISPEELMQYIPQVKDICDFHAVQLLNLDSSNMEPKHWKMMVHTIHENYEKYDGFVIAHGTDTMAYTAAALSYMIQNSKKPIVITGAQKPIDLEITDAKSNLLDSFLYASDENSQGVQIVFDGKVIAGTRAKKVRSKSYNAFSSIDFPCLAMIQDGNIMRYIPPVPYEEEVWFYDLRTNMPSFGKTNPLKQEHFKDFITAYTAEDRHAIEDERWNVFTREELGNTLDKGLIRDDSVLDYEDLPDPIESGEECIAQLEEAVDLLKSVVKELKSLESAEV